MAAPGRRHGDRRDGGRAGAAARAAVHPRHRAEPLALPGSEGDDHRPVLRTQPARRNAGRARQEPLRLRPPLHRCGHLGHEHAAEGEGCQRQGRGVRPGCAHRHRAVADAARHGAAGARSPPPRRRSRQPVAREAADRNADRGGADSRACRPSARGDLQRADPGRDRRPADDDRAHSVLARHRSGDAEGTHQAALPRVAER